MTNKLKFKSGDDWAEFRPGSKAPADWPMLTVTLGSGYREAFVEELKTEIPGGARAWDRDAKVWHILPSYQGLAEQIACRHFSSVWITEGSETRDLKTGMTQVGLF